MWAGYYRQKNLTTMNPTIVQSTLAGGMKPVPEKTTGNLHRVTEFIVTCENQSLGHGDIAMVI